MPGRISLTATGLVITASPGLNAGRMLPVRTLAALMCSANFATARPTHSDSATSATAHCSPAAARSGSRSALGEEAVVTVMMSVFGQTRTEFDGQTGESRQTTHVAAAR